MVQEIFCEDCNIVFQGDSYEKDGNTYGIDIYGHPFPDHFYDIDAVIVDLPYFKVVKDKCDNQWKDEKEYLDWVFYTFLHIDNFLKKGANIIVFCSRQHARHIANILEDDLNWTEQRTIIWARKRGFNNTRGAAFASGYEPILYFTKGEKKTFNLIKIKPETTRKEYTEGTLKDGVTLSDVWNDIPALPHNSKEKLDHPTQKPLKLMERIVEVFTNPGQIVLDFCMGTGTTGMACKNLGRHFIGIEKERKYFDIAKERLNITSNYYIDGKYFPKVGEEINLRP